MLLSASMQYAVFNIRARSLIRGTVLVIGSVVLALVLGGFPDIRPSPLLLVPTLLTGWGTWETIRCLRRRWSFYHGGVLLLLYADILALALVVFLLLYPYAQWLQGH
ncbi:MAG TPA: permease [Acidobacteriaceae bacterium]|jgi:hypothetical protein|nr:permease [Acidobacteriaceae bacterium]